MNKTYGGFNKDGSYFGKQPYADQSSFRNCQGSHNHSHMKTTQSKFFNKRINISPQGSKRGRNNVSLMGGGEVKTSPFQVQRYKDYQNYTSHGPAYESSMIMTRKLRSSGKYSVHYDKNSSMQSLLGPSSKNK